MSYFESTVILTDLSELPWGHQNLYVASEDIDRFNSAENSKRRSDLCALFLQLASGGLKIRTGQSGPEAVQMTIFRCDVDFSIIIGGGCGDHSLGLVFPQLFSGEPIQDVEITIVGSEEELVSHRHGR